MSQHEPSRGIRRTIARKPLQAGKFVGILLALLFGIGGFLRIFNLRAVIGHPTLADGQFLAIVLIPLVSLGLVVVVVLETIVDGYRSIRSDESIQQQLTGRPTYVLLRVIEAAIAVTGVAIMVAALPVLFAESTPAPAGVGLMLLLLVIGFAILLTSFIRSGVELVRQPVSG